MVEYKVEAYQTSPTSITNSIRKEVENGWHPISISVTESSLSCKVKYILFKKG